MIDISGQPKKFLVNAVLRGDAFLILGAGASKTSKNRENNGVLLGLELAALISRRAGIPYNKESLKSVLSACIPRILSREQFHDILQYEFQDIKPSDELIKLLKFSWKRLYTWNIDDSIEAVRSAAQRLKFYNGMCDKAHSDHGLEVLPVVHLHGDAAKPEHGFIFTESEYNKCLIENRHSWYRQLAQDYSSGVPIFIGSQLEEPILSLELDRARPIDGEPLGQAFLISPAELSEIQRLDYEARNIVYLQGTLDDFVELIRSEVGVSHRPADVASEISEFASSAVKVNHLNSQNAIVATYIFQLCSSSIIAEVHSYSAEVRKESARNFLEGSPPNWRIAASPAPVWLEQTDELFRYVTRSVFDRRRLGVVVGQLGSGKSTALMQALVRYSRDNEDVAFYEIRGEVPSLKAALDLLSSTVVSDHIIVYISDISLFGDSFIEDVTSIPAGRMTIFSSVRTREWNTRLKRQSTDVARPFMFERFSPKDYDPLIERLLKYVPSPALMRMDPSQRRQRLAQSSEQLLIALKETTYAEAFTNVITAEFEGLSSIDEQRLLLICGLGSLSRAGVDPGATREAYEASYPRMSFDEALNALGGIVVKHENGRYSARHELYVRHIFDSVADFSEVASSIKAVLATFTKYEHPIIKNVARLDKVLFKYLLSHNFIKELASSHGSRLSGLEIYKEFEVEFQLDGHFWLQYGQYLAEVGELDQAMTMFDRSIKAYEDNEFAWHALADLQLRVAARRSTYDAQTRELISKAVATLVAQDETMGGPSDHYAIVTLAHVHVGALVAHNQVPLALESAGRYITRIAQIRKSNDDEVLSGAFERLLRFTTSKVWPDTPFSTVSSARSHRLRGRRGK